MWLKGKESLATSHSQYCEFFARVVKFRRMWILSWKVAEQDCGLEV